jgi:methylthioribose-1-phosphate isomerase
LDRCLKRALAAVSAEGPQAVAAAVENEAVTIFEEDLQSCYAIGEHGAPFVPAQATVMTHCNAGALATAGYGTALGVVRAAWARGCVCEVLACETRPRQQGARLTTWELVQEGVKVRLLADTAAGHLMRTGLVDVIVVGADRIAANGDVANKIGTYALAVLAAENGIPFIVAAPLSTVDRTCAAGDDIEIEYRASDEVTGCGGARVAPPTVEGINPAFDVTPARFVKAVVTEAGVAHPPNAQTIGALFGGVQRPDKP